MTGVPSPNLARIDAELEYDGAHHYGGRCREPIGGRSFVTTNPATGRRWGRFAEGDADDVAHAVAAARAAFDTDWGAHSPTRRGQALARWADLIARDGERLARLETAQNGKILRDSLAQFTAIPNWLRYFGGLADKIEGSVVPLEQASILNYTLREPIGVVGVITPWNSPAMLTIVAVAPALAVGNTVVVKPSEFTSASLIEIAKLADEAGLPPGVVNVVTGARAAGEALIDHPDVGKVAFTGSVEGGRAVARKAAERLIGATLELGGKSPNIVFDDADLAAAEAGVLGGIFASSGQTCVAGSRLYVQSGVYDRFVNKLVERAEAIVVGDPLDPSIQMGPIATEAQLAKIEQSVALAIAQGARLLCGGTRPYPAGGEDGMFYTPTLLGDLPRDAEILRSEVFGPVLCVIRFDTEDEVVALANDSPFGLAAGCWTLDVRRAHRLARRLQAGTVWINMYRALAFNSPFGGHKASGLGVQNGINAVDPFLKTKSVWCETATGFRDAFAPPSPPETIA